MNTSPKYRTGDVIISGGYKARILEMGDRTYTYVYIETEPDGQYSLLFQQYSCNEWKSWGVTIVKDILARYDRA